jgi:hypothetical protein
MKNLLACVGCGILLEVTDVTVFTALFTQLKKKGNISPTHTRLKNNL